MTAETSNKVLVIATIAFVLVAFFASLCLLVRNPRRQRPLCQQFPFLPECKDRCARLKMEDIREACTSECASRSVDYRFASYCLSQGYRAHE